MAGRRGQDVLGECNIDCGQEVRKAVIDHCAGAVGCFLSRLKECDQGAAPVIAASSQELGRPEQRGDVYVVSAGMHDRYLVAIGVGGLHGADESSPVASFTGQASMSARSSTVGPGPLRSTPITPVPPMLPWTS
ncbi:hypothetical protein ACVWWN_004496 [Mycobacterium sp. URHB0021]